MADERDVLMRVTSLSHDIEDDGTIVVTAAGRDECGDRRTIQIDGTVPYLYVPDDEVDAVSDDKRVRDVTSGFESYDGKPLSRVDTLTPQHAGELADAVDDDHEADIPYYRRCTIDYDLSGYIRVPETRRCSIDAIETDPAMPSDPIEPRLLIADIEVLQFDAGLTIPELLDEYSQPISHITAWDSYEDEYIALYLDPDGAVEPDAVSDALNAHLDADAVAEEVDRPITLRRFDDESALLRGFIRLVEKRRPDVTSGWNWVEFDWDYLLGRMAELDLGDVTRHELSDTGYASRRRKLPRMVDGLPAFDMMDGFTETMSFGEWRSKGLDYVAKRKLDVGKMPNVDITDAFENRPSDLLAYNIIDVALTVALDRHEAIHEFHLELAELCQVELSDTSQTMRLVDGYLMSQSSDAEILPSMEESDIPPNDGGLVLTPADGIEEWVGVVDLKSLYPSVIITWNISPETTHFYDDMEPGPVPQTIDIPWLPNADEADGGEFGHDAIGFDTMWSDLSTEGLIPKYLRRLFPRRAKFKRLRDENDPEDELYGVYDRKQAAIKVVMNSFYGVMSNNYWRLGQYGLGDAVTSAARYALWMGKEIAEKRGYETIYGDTDSVLVSLAEPDEDIETALDRGHELEAHINEGMDRCVAASNLTGTHPYLDADGELHGTDRHALVYEFEKLYRRFIQAGSKKRYAGRIVWTEGKRVDGDIDTTGFEAQRSDAPELTERAQPEVINRILAGESFDEVSAYIRGLIDDIEAGDIEPYEIALPSSLGQPLDDYGNTQVARACRYANQTLDADWRVGDDPWMYFVESTPTMAPGTDVLALDWTDDVPDGFDLDIDKHLERALESPLEPILDEVGWRWTELKQGAQTTSAAGGDWSGEWNTDDQGAVADADEDTASDWGW
ncbi:DNA-directed DNA polymerase [Halorubrum sp. C191]|uniref:DNA-directed DNA polymerase n=1 Tax=Halorubrum sp. C191 TaxID=1383842 RepID=UPI00130436BF|nr:DNA-directed DNA polymerase [Halorubrum sp. C191]